MPKKAERISFTCKTCSNSFEIKKSEAIRRAKRFEIQFCSHKCASIGKKTAIIKQCSICNGNFETTRAKYCSMECSRIARTNKAKGKTNGFWFENGYKVLYVAGKSNGKKEHIAIMENQIGREIKKGEHVHHINGIKTDNRLENLQLMTVGEHSRLHRNLEKDQGRKFGRYIQEVKP